MEGLVTTAGRIAHAYPAGTVLVLPPGGGPGCSIEWRSPQQAYDDAVRCFGAWQRAEQAYVREQWKLRRLVQHAGALAELAARLHHEATALLSLLDSPPPHDQKGQP